MYRFIVAIFVLTASSSLLSAPPCPRQPMPSPIDSLSPLPSYKPSISFAAVPLLGGRAWAIRMDRAANAAPGMLEIVHLRRQANCNRYDVETKWQAPLSDQQYRLLADKITPFAIASPDQFSGTGPSQGHEIVLDGTGIVLKVKTIDWDVTRSLNHYGRDGAELSAIFHEVVSKHVPEWEAPKADWRSRPE